VTARRSRKAVLAETIAAEAIIAERSGILAHVTRRRAGLSIAVRAGRLTQADADLIERAVAAFAEDCAIGLHVQGETPVEVRDAMRPLVLALNDSTGTGA